MFADAYEKLAKCTLPVVISNIDGHGKCGAGIGTFLVVNTDGWCLTALHIFAGLKELDDQTQVVETYDAERKRILDDPNLKAPERQQKLRKLKLPPKGHAVAVSAWWAGLGSAEPSLYYDPAVDLALFRLRDFDPTKVDGYPVFKDPSKPLRAGTMLCRLGYPFHTITPTYDASNGSFSLPPGAVPLPRFPIEGILTRLLQVDIQGETTPPWEHQMVETSSPGLMGQSGGPIFDAHGAVWAIQSQTRSLDLGFSPEKLAVDPSGGAPQVVTEHQFLNVGRGPSVVPIVGLMDLAGASYALAPH